MRHGALAIALALFAATGSAVAQVTLTAEMDCYEAGSAVSLTLHNGTPDTITFGDNLRIETASGDLVWEPLCTNDAVYSLDPGESQILDTSWDQTDMGSGGTVGSCNWADAQQVSNGCYRAITNYNLGPAEGVSAAFGIVDCACAPSGTLTGPAVVQADETGVFVYDATFTAGQNGATLLLWSIVSGANAAANDVDVDAKCMTILTAGETEIAHVEGALIDPTLAGDVSVIFRTCDGDTLTLQTTIQPAEILSVPAMSTTGLLVMVAVFVGMAFFLFRRV